jgi:hypothetical protein
MKKTIYTLNIDNYAPEITKLTYPFFEFYADRIGAKFEILTKRKFPEFPITCEKFQLYELSQENDWSIFVDSDLFLSPNMYDFTKVVPKDTVVNGTLNSGNFRWKEDDDKDFLRDGRYLAVCSWLVICSDWCYNFWKPIDKPIDITDKVNLWLAEKIFKLNPNHLLDEYVMSKNAAKYRINLKEVLDYNRYEFKDKPFFWHNHLMTIEEKTANIKILAEKFKI